MGKYGKIIEPGKMPTSKITRLPQYDEALREFIDSKGKYYEINLEALPSQNPRLVLSSLKWRIKNNSEFRDIKVVMKKGRIYLERVTPL